MANEAKLMFGLDVKEFDVFENIDHESPVEVIDGADKVAQSVAEVTMNETILRCPLPSSFMIES